MSRQVNLRFSPLQLRHTRFANLQLHAILVASVVAIWYIAEPAITLAAGGALMFVGLLVMAWRESRRSPLRLTPLSFYFLWQSLGLGTSAMYMGFRVSGGDWIS